MERVADREDLLRFVERFAMGLTEVGLPRMPARVFAYVLADDAERYTAAELASGLRVSPAAISGAVRMLVAMRLLGREREPGARVDTYRVYDHDLWGMIAMQRAQLIEPFEKLAAEGVELLGPESPGGRRMRETQEYYAFFRRKLAEMTDEWQEYRRKLFPELDPTPGPTGPDPTEPDPAAPGSAAFGSAAPDSADRARIAGAG